MKHIPFLTGVAIMVTPFMFAVAGCDVAPSERATISATGLAQESADPTNAFTCTVSSITDGDTFRCAELEPNGKQIRVRLSGIAAREKDGGCTEGHPCPNASAEAATAVIETMALGKSLRCRQVNLTYGRRAAFCSLPGGEDLSCAMVDSGTVEKWPKHWGSHRC
jgi:endonuclease YncB( thermonuclease family)